MITRRDEPSVLRVSRRLKLIVATADPARMSRSRQPVSGTQLAGAGIGVGFAVIAPRIVPGATVGSWVLALLVLAFVVEPLATLGHELGHALAVGLLTGRPSLVVVGRGPHVRIKAEPATVLFSVMPTRGVPFSGLCRYEPRGLSSRTSMWIALAGPAATAMELLGAAGFALAAWGNAGSTLRLILLETLLSLGASLIFNLWPEPDALSPPATRAPSIRRDGSKALLAHRLHRAGARSATAAG